MYLKPRSSSTLMPIARNGFDSEALRWNGRRFTRTFGKVLVDALLFQRLCGVSGAPHNLRTLAARVTECAFRQLASGPLLGHQFADASLGALPYFDRISGKL